DPRVATQGDGRAAEDRLMVPIQYNVRSLFVRKVTTIATAVGIALVVFVFAGSLMLRHGISEALTASGRPDTVIVLRKGSDNELSSAITNEAMQLLRGGHSEIAQIESGAAVIGEVVVVLAAERSDGSGAISNVTLR